MASLKFIMDMEDDEPPSQADKRGGGPANQEGSRAHGSSITTSQGTTGDDLTDRNPQASARRRGVSSRSSKQPVVAPSSSSTSSTLRPVLARGSSDLNPDPMDPSRYGQASGSSSGAANPSAPSIRPMVGPSGEEMPVRLTPITRRVSRAKKGVPVHRCEICRPPKTFSRAEHLRRHQLSHQAATFACTVPGCDRTFYRRDLLTRHMARHDSEGADASKSPSAGPSRRPSSSLSAASYEGGGSSTRMGSVGPGTGAVTPEMTPSSFSTNSPYHPGHHGMGAGGSTSMSPPQPPGGGSGLRRPSDPSGYYELSRSIPVIRNQAPSTRNSPVSGPGGSFHAPESLPVPRTSAFGDGLLLPIVTEDWPTNPIMSAFTPTTTQDLGTAGDAMMAATQPSFHNPWASSTQIASPHQSQAFFPLDIPMTYPDDPTVYDPSQHYPYSSSPSHQPFRMRHH